MDLSLGPLIALRFDCRRKPRMITKETNTRNVSITRATFDDSEGILSCLRAAFEPYRAQYTPAGHEDTVMTSGTVRKRSEDMTVLIARNEAGLIIGTIGAAARGAEGHIRGMAVVPSWQGGGGGERVREALERERAAGGS